MSRPDMSLAMVGALHSNADGSNRQFEIAMCSPGEPVRLVPEPRNRYDPSAVAVFSARGFQIGYVSAERCAWIGSKINQGEDVRAIIQRATPRGAVIRLSFSGEDPVLPPEPVRRETPPADDDFWPDYIRRIELPATPHRDHR
jgi:hypothetical protein